MGAFHDGHLALFRAARAENDTVVASLFVNPAQFGAERGSRRATRATRRATRALAEEAGVDLLFAPAADELYPAGFQTWVEVEELGSALEGAHRPGHFRGVATVCLKLFNIVRPDRAYFGQKDAQQVAVVKRLVRDLNLTLEIRVVPTVRDEDGLALSSRNAYLSPEERERGARAPAGAARRGDRRRRRRRSRSRLHDGLDVRLRRGRRLRRPPRPRRRRPRRRHPPDRQRHPRRRSSREHPPAAPPTRPTPGSSRSPSSPR